MIVDQHGKAFRGPSRSAVCKGNNDIVNGEAALNLQNNNHREHRQQKRHGYVFEPLPLIGSIQFRSLIQFHRGGLKTCQEHYRGHCHCHPYMYNQHAIHGRGFTGKNIGGQPGNVQCLSDYRNNPVKNLIEDQSHHQHSQHRREEKDSPEKRFKPDIAIENQCQNQADSHDQNYRKNCKFDVEFHGILKTAVGKCFNIICQPHKLKVLCQSVPVGKTVHDSDYNRIDKKYTVENGRRHSKQKHRYGFFTDLFLFSVFHSCPSPFPRLFEFRPEVVPSAQTVQAVSHDFAVSFPV